jgi:hypothetical protein
MTTTAQFKTALANAQATYASALNAFIAALIDLESLTETCESCGAGQQIAVSRLARDNLQTLMLELQHPTAAPIASVAASLRTNAATLTSSAVLGVASVPAWVAAGMAVSNAAGTVIGVVASAVPGSTTVTLAANVTVAVAAGDVLAFSLRGATGLADHVRRSTAAYTATWSGN